MKLITTIQTKSLKQFLSILKFSMDWSNGNFNWNPRFLRMAQNWESGWGFKSYYKEWSTEGGNSFLGEVNGESKLHQEWEFSFV